MKLNLKHLATVQQKPSFTMYATLYYKALRLTLSETTLTCLFQHINEYSGGDVCGRNAMKC